MANFESHNPREQGRKTSRSRVSGSEAPAPSSLDDRSAKTYRSRRHSDSPSSASSRFTSSTKPNGERLCETCERINFRRYVNEPMKSTVLLGRWRDIRRNSRDCHFCRLVVSAVQLYPANLSGQGDIKLFNEKVRKLCIVHCPYDGKKVERYSTTREIAENVKASGGRSVYRFTLLTRSGREVGQIQHVPKSGPRSYQLFGGREVSQGHVNMELVSSWLPRCQRVHGIFCEESGRAAQRLPYIRVIDTIERTVIDAPHACRYVALSYVWGKSNVVEARQANIQLNGHGSQVVRLPERLPQTIEDAMHVTRLLGERYLWVDCLCIIQDNPHDKRMQIGHMDAIYSSAFVTIAAACGNDSNAGLAGISRPRAAAQSIETIRGSMFSVPLPGFMDLMSDPSIVWNSRGWTFQEKVLSKRLLVFTEYQVYFQCSNMVWYEDAAMETEGSPDTTKINWRPLRWAADRTPHSPQNGVYFQTVIDEYLTAKFENQGEYGSLYKGLVSWALSGLFNGVRKSARKGFATDQQMGQIALFAMNRVKFKTYTSAIQEFTQRQLSNQEDGINAVQGVLDTLSSQLGAFHCGLPESYLGPSLLWDPIDHGTVEKYKSIEAPFPSFSWSRWYLSNGAHWTTPNSESAVLENPAFLLTTSRLVKLSSPSSKTPVETPKLYYKELSPVAQTLLGRYGQMLYIKSTPVRLRIGAQLTSVGTRPEQANTVYQYCLERQGGSVVGHIRMSAAEREACGNSTQELLTVCWSTGYEGPRVPDFYVDTKSINVGTEDSPRYETVKLTPPEYRVANVLLVKWVNEVAERVALGNVVSLAWAGCQRRPRWTILG